MTHKTLFVVLFILLGIKGNTQEIYLPSTNYNNHFNTQMITGNFTIPIPLFEIPTASPDLSVNAQLIYNQNVADNIREQNYPNKSFLPIGTEFDFIPSINKIIYGQDKMDDELYYNYDNPYMEEPDYKDHPHPGRPSRPTPNIYAFSLFGVSGKFTLEESSNSMIVKVLNSSEKVTITPNITFNKQRILESKLVTFANPNLNYTSEPQYNYAINVRSFTITDSKGIRYIFDIKQESYFYFESTSYFYQYESDGGILRGLNKYTKSFLLREVRDRHNNVLMTYSYDTFEDQVKYLNKTKTYQQYYVSRIQVPNIGRVELNMNNNKFYNNIKFFNTDNTTIKDIDIYSFIHVVFHNKDRSSSYRYKIEESGLNKITYTSPTGGRTEYEMEKNTVSYYGGAAQNIGGTIGEISFPVSYMYQNYPSTYNNINGRYSFVYSTSDIQNTPLHLNFIGTFVPGLSSETRINLYASNGTLIRSIPPPNNTDGTDIRPILASFIAQPGNNAITNFYLRSSLSEAYTVSNVSLKKKVPNPNALLEREEKGKRLKRIVAYDDAYLITSEHNYSYKSPENALRTSGHIPLYKNQTEEIIRLYELPYTPCLYKDVLVETPGRGKISYSFDFSNGHFGPSTIQLSALSNIAREEKVYAADNTLVSKSVADVTTYPLSTSNSHEDKVLKSINKTVTDYRSGQSKELQTLTQWDQVHKNITSQKITDTKLSETFESRYTYTSSGVLVLPKTTKKYKNNILLNQSEHDYFSSGNRLRKTLTGKGSQPMESDKEITLYDSYGRVLEYSENGRITSQIWGYNNQYIVAELVNVSYSSINTTTLANIRNNSRALPLGNHNALVSALETLRKQHPNGMVTTYTYYPLIGQRSVTGPGGWTEYYEYDLFHRPYRVLNHQQQKVKEIRYQLKNN